MIISCPFCHKEVFEVEKILDEKAGIICGECKPKFELRRKAQDLDQMLEMIKKKDKSPFW